ncbi:MAG TPA: hypothetical protein VLB02_00100 [Candidatus Paceibacterota bacterium]|nr:hypothetical protein [Candidatus Paceibacterota bacterium]
MNQKNLLLDAPRPVALSETLSEEKLLWAIDHAYEENGERPVTLFEIQQQFQESTATTFETKFISKLLMLPVETAQRVWGQCHKDTQCALIFQDYGRFNFDLIEKLEIPVRTLTRAFTKQHVLHFGTGEMHDFSSSAEYLLILLKEMKKRDQDLLVPFLKAFGWVRLAEIVFFELEEFGELGEHKQSEEVLGIIQALERREVVVTVSPLFSWLQEHTPEVYSHVWRVLLQSSSFQDLCSSIIVASEDDETELSNNLREVKCTERNGFTLEKAITTADSVSYADPQQKELYGTGK